MRISSMSAANHMAVNASYQPQSQVRQQSNPRFGNAQDKLANEMIAYTKALRTTEEGSWLRKLIEAMRKQAHEDFKKEAKPKK